jgi:RNA polymerase sigma-70 factor (ECF subfamily)
MIVGLSGRNMTRPAPEVVEVLVENHRRFRLFLEQQVGSPEDAEDILQDAFLKGVGKADTVREEDSVVAWFYSLLRNSLTDYYRKRGVRQRALSRVAVDQAGPQEDWRPVEQAICQCIDLLLPILPESYAEIIRSVDLEGRSIISLATESGLTANSLRVRLYRARRALRRQLELSCGTCTEHKCLDCSCGATRSRGRLAAT